MEQQTVIIGGVVVAAGAALLALAACCLGWFATPPGPYKPVNYDMTIKDENGKFDIQPDSDTQWTLHPTDTITFTNQTNDEVKVFSIPLGAYTTSGNFTIPGGQSEVKTVNTLQVGGNPLVITNSFGDPSNIRGPRMVVTPSSSGT